MKIIFILPGGGGGGGSYSVVQEAIGLARFGVDAAIAVREPDRLTLFANHPELEERRLPTPGFQDAPTLAAAIDGFDIAVATTAASAVLLDAALNLATSPPRPAHYLQDYEPLFFAPGSPEWDVAIRSLGVFPEGLRFSKSDWIAGIVAANHALTVERVSPSIDLDIFHPAYRQDERPSVLTICAMIRPKTPRRGPHRTARILSRIAEAAEGRLRIVAFGSTPDALSRHGVSLHRSVTDLGALNRRQVAALLRQSDLFLDLSDYQAFGRTAAEAMACGCLAAAPIFGAAQEFITHDENGFLIDTRSDEAVMDLIARVREIAPDTWRLMRNNAVRVGLGFSVERACFSMIELFSKHLRTA